MRKTNSNDLASAVMNELERYKRKTTDEVKKAVMAVSEKAKKEIRDSSPKNKGTYAKGWRKKMTKETGDAISVTIYNPKGYRLSHLLEYGHAKRNGGRVKAQVHIQPAQEKAIKDLEKEIRKKISDE